MDSDQRPPDAGVWARPGLRVDVLPHGTAAHLASSTGTDDVLRVKGYTELTAHNCELFMSETSAALNGHTSIEIDLSRTTFMDCTGLSSLIALRKCALHRNGVLRLVSPTPPVQLLLEIVRADQMFEIVGTVGLHPMACGQSGE